MAKKPTLFEEAIAEANQLRQAAYANAKESLEDSITPKIKELLLKNLQESLDETEEVNESEEIDETVETVDESQEEVVSEEEDTEEEVIDDEEVVDDETREEEGDELPEDETEMEEVPDNIKDLTDLIKSIIAQEVGVEDLQGDEESLEGEEDVLNTEIPEEEPGMETDSEEEVIDLDEILAELGFGDEVNEKEVEEGTQEPPKTTNLDAHGNRKKKPMKEAEEVSLQERVKALEKELKESKASLTKVTGELKEVNLINAKLLYLNRIFKANDLNENQKANTVKAFDKAETVGEVKVIYETMTTALKESREKRTSKRKQSMTEHIIGGSSKSTAPKETLKENKDTIQVSEAVRRMQFLAGIK